MTIYSSTINRETLAEYVSRLQIDPVIKQMYYRITLKRFNTLSADQVRREARKMTGLDILTVSQDKFIIRYN